MLKWEDIGDNSLFLFTVNEYDQLPDGIELESINGSKKIKGQDYIGMDTRDKYIAFGVRSPLTHKEKHLLLTFLLKT